MTSDISKIAQITSRVTYSEPISEIKILRVCEPICAEKADAPDLMVKMWKEYVETAQWYDPNKEALVVFLMNTKLRVTEFCLVSLGSLNESLAHPREIFKPVICGGAHCFVLMHNHPSGDSCPSEADRRITTRLREVSVLMQISLLDHIIVGKWSESSAGYFSFRESGLL